MMPIFILQHLRPISLIQDGSLYYGHKHYTTLSPSTEAAKIHGLAKQKSKPKLNALLDCLPLPSERSTLSGLLNLDCRPADTISAGGSDESFETFIHSSALYCSFYSYGSNQFKWLLLPLNSSLASECYLPSSRLYRFSEQSHCT